MARGSSNPVHDRNDSKQGSRSWGHPQTGPSGPNDWGLEQLFEEPEASSCDLKETLRQALQLGTRRLDIECGFLTRIDPGPGEHKIVRVSSPHSQVQEGRTSNLSETYCRMVIAEGDLLSVHDAEVQGWGEDPVLDAFGLSCYIGEKVLVRGRLYGTVCFASSTPRPEPFTGEEKTFVHRLAARIGRALERREYEDLLEERERDLEVTTDLLRRTQEVAQVGGWKLDLCWESYREDRPSDQVGSEQDPPDRDAILAALAEGQLAWTDEAHRLHDRPSAQDQGIAAVLRLYSRADRRRLLRALVNTARNGVPFRLDVSLTTRPRTGRRLRILGQPRPAEPCPHQVVGTVQNVTGRWRREKQLRLFREVIEQSPSAVVITEAEPLDEPGPRIEYVNSAFEEITGYSVEEATGRTPRLLQGPDTDRDTLDAVRERLEAGSSFTAEVLNYKKDGTPFYNQWNLAPVQGEDGEIEHWVSIQNDVTARHRREEALHAAKQEAEAAQAEAERASQLRAALLTNVSHEIRTPLTSIIGLAETIQDEVTAGTDGAPGVDEEAVGRFARLIERSGGQLMEMLDGVLTLSKLEAGEMSFSTGPLDLAEKTEQIAGAFEARANEKGLALHHRAEEEALAQADANGLQIALRPLLSNAIKYTEEGGEIWVRAYSGIGPDQTADEDQRPVATLEVEDTGIGMDPDRVPEFFEAFRQGSTGNARSHGGTGLGLTVMKEAVEQMGGAVDVETEQGEGTRVLLRFPGASPN
jgi:PAS domain S-box-containing protein